MSGEPAAWWGPIGERTGDWGVSGLWVPVSGRMGDWSLM